MVMVPATVSNNIPGSDLSIGSDTALNAITDQMTELAASKSACCVGTFAGRRLHFSLLSLRFLDIKGNVARCFWSPISIFILSCQHLHTSARVTQPPPQPPPPAPHTPSHILPANRKPKPLSPGESQSAAHKHIETHKHTNTQIHTRRRSNMLQSCIFN
ncbi:hypothetical protein PAMP_005298 [Pampus punctatissimus]